MVRLLFHFFCKEKQVYSTDKKIGIKQSVKESPSPENPTVLFFKAVRAFLLTRMMWRFSIYLIFVMFFICVCCFVMVL